MMGRRKISPPRFERGRFRGRPIASRGSRRFLVAAVALSVTFHVWVALLVVLLPRFVPRDAGPREEGTVELLMVEQKGAQPSQAAQPQERPSSSQPDKAAEVRKQQAQEADAQATVAQPVPAPSVATTADEPALTPAEETPQKATKADDKPDTQRPVTPPPKTSEAPIFDLAGTESESNAEVLGGRIVPASPDNRFRNRPPIYPKDAELRGQHGAVVLVIHVSETGVPTGVDVLETSGVESLDQAAMDAVRKWHFRPALRAGRSIPFDMPFRFIFDTY
jgi:periplasmic protein TonB